MTLEYMTKLIDDYIISGGLSVAVEGSSKAEIKCKDNRDGTCDVTYWPVNIYLQYHVLLSMLDMASKIR